MCGKPRSRGFERTPPHLVRGDSGLARSKRVLALQLRVTEIASSHGSSKLPEQVMRQEQPHGEAEFGADESGAELASCELPGG
jgi:hypothetical protein